MGGMGARVLASSYSKYWRHLSPQVYSEDGNGYVQDVFLSDKENLEGLRDPARVAAVLVGQKSMFETLRGALQAAGVAPERILTNY